MALDRSKFKATSIAKAVEQDQEIAASLGKSRSGFTGYIKLEDGVNIIRIYPPHAEEDGGGEVFAEPKVTVFLPMMVPERDSQGQEIIENGRPKLKEGVKSVFNSRIHGNTEKDLVEQYVSIGLKKLEREMEGQSDPKKVAEITEKINRLKGNYALKIQGLNYQSKWALYADRIVGKTATFGTLEIGAAIKERLNSLAASTDSENNPLATDPFTDIEEGRAVVITYNKSATKPQDYYKTELDAVMEDAVIAGKTYKMPRLFPLTDEQLEVFDKAEPLKKRFVNVFSRKDFNLQMEGLEYFDQKHKIGLFQDDEFIAVCEEIDGYYPDDTTNEEDGSGVIETQATHAPVVADEPEHDMFDLMDRKELGDWHRANKSGVIVKPTIKDDQLRDMAREHLAAMEEEGGLEAEEVNSNEDDSQAEETQVEEVQTTKTTTLSRIAAMRAKAGVK